VLVEKVNFKGRFIRPAGIGKGRAFDRWQAGSLRSTPAIQAWAGNAHAFLVGSGRVRLHFDENGAANQLQFLRVVYVQ